MTLGYSYIRYENHEWKWFDPLGHCCPPEPITKGALLHSYDGEMQLYTCWFVLIGRLWVYLPEIEMIEYSFMPTLDTTRYLFWFKQGFARYLDYHDWNKTSTSNNLTNLLYRMESDLGMRVTKL